MELSIKIAFKSHNMHKVSIIYISHLQYEINKNKEKYF